MEKSLATNKNLNYVALLFLVLLLAISLSACGSTTVEDLNNIINPSDNPNDSVNNDINYEISGYGVIKDEGDFFGINLTLVNVNLTSGEFYFSDEQERMEYRSTEITGISVAEGTATITAKGEYQEFNGIYEGGYTFEITITDDTPDKFSITIKDTNSTVVYESSPQPINIVEGNFEISII